MYIIDKVHPDVFEYIKDVPNTQSPHHEGWEYVWRPALQGHPVGGYCRRHLWHSRACGLRRPRRGPPLALVKWF